MDPNPRRHRLLPGALSRWLLVAGLAIGLSSAPRDLVWCHAASGHSALEPLDAGCCAGPADETRCTAAGTGSSPGAGVGGGERGEGEGCTDTLLEAPTRLPEAQRSSLAPPAVLSLPADETPLRAEPGPPPGHREGEARAARHERNRTTVLRV